MTAQRTYLPRVAEPVTLEQIRHAYQHHRHHLALAATDDLDDEERYTYHLGLSYTRYPDTDRIVGDVMDSIARRQTQSLATITRLTGLAMSGKSRLAMLICFLLWDENCPTGHDDYLVDGMRHDLIPAPYVKTPSSRELDFMHRCLASLGVPRAAMRGTATQLLDRWAELCDRHHVKAVVVDDIQLAASRSHTSKSFMKNFVDVTPAHVICTETTGKPSPLQDDQLAERGAVHPVGLTMPLDRAGAARLARAVKAQESCLRLHRHEPGQLLTKELLRWIAELSNFRLGTALAAIALAGANAVGKTEFVGRPELEVALRMLRGTA